MLDEKGSTILKTAIETPLVFLIYSNLRAIWPLPVSGERGNVENEKPFTVLSDMDAQIMVAVPNKLLL